MINEILIKFAFRIKKPAVVVVCGKSQLCSAEAIYHVLRGKFRAKKVFKPRFSDFLGNNVLIFCPREGKEKGLSFFFKSAEKSIVVLTNVGDISPDFLFFAGEEEDIRGAAELAKKLSARGYLISNFDDETTREVGDMIEAKHITFGLQKGADFLATDIKIDEASTNFKVNFQGSSVPVWLDRLFGKEQIYASLAAITVGAKLGLNLVEISQSLKNYASFPGKMRMRQGIKGALVIDDSESASPHSMAESLQVLKKVKSEGRKIAVLGDILGLGKYTIGAHEAIGERIKGSADLLFTLGTRAKFLAEGARNQGFDPKNIFEFLDRNELVLKLKETIKEKDVILIDGSKEMDMGSVARELEAH